MRLPRQFAKILVKGVAVLVNTPEVLRLRAGLAYLRQRLDEFEASVDKRFAELRDELQAEFKKLEIRMKDCNYSAHAFTKAKAVSGLSR